MKPQQRSIQYWCMVECLELPFVKVKLSEADKARRIPGTDSCILGFMRWMIAWYCTMRHCTIGQL